MIPRLHLILDLAELARSGRDPVAVAVAAAQGGAGAVHLRGHGYHAGELLALTRALQTALSCQALLLGNDRLALIAIGGITPRAAGQAVAGGADGVAAIRAITEAADPSAAAAALLRAVDLAHASRASSAAKPELIPRLPALPPNLLDLAHGE